MKTKLIFAAIFIILALVGYKTYTEIKTLKSINSYESCTTAKGSVIQESYPATCVTRLGSHFTQNIQRINPDTGWNIYIDPNSKIYFEYPSDWYYDGKMIHNLTKSKLETLINTTGLSRSSEYFGETIEFIDDYLDNWIATQYLQDNYFQYKVKSKTNKKIGNYSIYTYVLCNGSKIMNKGAIMKPGADCITRSFLDSGRKGIVNVLGRGSILMTANDTYIKILSTFKFTN